MRLIEDRFWSSCLLLVFMEYLGHKKFLARFGESRAKFLRTHKNLSAPTPIFLCRQNITVKCGVSSDALSQGRPLADMTDCFQSGPVPNGGLLTYARGGFRH